MTDDVQSACKYDVRNARSVDRDEPIAENREKCGICFDDGTIPEDVDEVVTGRYTSKVHLPDSYDVDDGAHSPDNPVAHSDGLAATIGAEDFGPDDLDDLAAPGGSD